MGGGALVTLSPLEGFVLGAFARALAEVLIYPYTRAKMVRMNSNPYTPLGSAMSMHALGCEVKCQRNNDQSESRVLALRVVLFCMAIPSGFGLTFARGRRLGKCVGYCRAHANQTQR